RERNVIKTKIKEQMSLINASEQTIQALEKEISSPKKHKNDAKYEDDTHTCYIDLPFEETSQINKILVSLDEIISLKNRLRILEDMVYSRISIPQEKMKRDNNLSDTNISYQIMDPCAHTEISESYPLTPNITSISARRRDGGFPVGAFLRKPEETIE
ncbi:hypothetical protein J6590_100346, partial [Homalodisca vitripennis]